MTLSIVATVSELFCYDTVSVMSYIVLKMSSYYLCAIHSTFYSLFERFDTK